MSSFRWAVIGREPQSERYQLLSDYLNDNGIVNELKFIDCGIGEFQQNLEDAQKKFDSIRFDSPYREAVVNYFTRITSSTLTLKAADCLVKADDGVWWLKSSDCYGVEKVIEGLGGGLDLDSSALVVGAGAMARFSVAALSKVGFKSFNITSKFDDQGKELVEELRRTYFGCQFTFVSQDRLVLLPGTNGIIVNTTPLKVSNDLLTELYYFNFLKSEGIAIESTIVPPKTPLVQEARAIGTKVVYGYEIAAQSDICWVKWVLGKSLDQLAYTDHLAAGVSAVKFDLTPFTSQSQTIG